MPRGLSVEEAHELGGGNAILQLQKDVQTLATSLVDILTRFREDLGGPRRRERGQLRHDLTSDHSSSSQDEYSPRCRRR